MVDKNNGLRRDENFQGLDFEIPAIRKKNIEGDLTEFFEGYQDDIRKRIEENINTAREENPFEGKGVFALPDFEKRFDITGTVKVSFVEYKQALDSDPILKKYFSKPGRTYEKSSTSYQNSDGDTIPEFKEVYLNGARHVAAIDKNLGVDGVLEVLMEDLKEVLPLLLKIKKGEIRINNQNLLFYTSILQTAKNSILTVFNALIIREKKGDFQLKNKEYQILREKIGLLTEELIKSVYSLLCGKKIEFTESLGFTESCIDDVDLYLRNHAQFTHFSRPEAIHPLSMMATTFNVVRENPEIETIVSVPAGGTELAVLQKIAYEEILGVLPEISIIPFSRYSVKYEVLDDPDDAFDLPEYVKTQTSKLKGKKILIIDDNSGTGLTLEMIKTYIEKLNPKSITCRVSEVGLPRTELNLEDNRTDAMTDIAVYNASSGILPTHRNNRKKKGRDIRLEQEKSLLVKFYEQKLENAQAIEEQIIAKVQLDNIGDGDPTTNSYKPKSIYRDRVRDQAIREKLKKENPETPYPIIKGGFISCFEGPIKVKKGKGEVVLRVRNLSNFSKSPVEMNGIVYPTVEHAYQAAKFEDLDLKSVIGDRTDIYDAINSMLDSRGAKFRINEENINDIFTIKSSGAGSVKFIVRVLNRYIKERDGWHSDEKLKVMTNLLIQKFTRNEALKTLLLQTGSKILVEGNHWGDIFWGVDNSTPEAAVGNNFLGRILMEIRKLIRQKKI